MRYDDGGDGWVEASGLCVKLRDVLSLAGYLGISTYCFSLEQFNKSGLVIDVNATEVLSGRTMTVFF
jgi:hypothetical protein